MGRWKTWLWLGAMATAIAAANAVWLGIDHQPFAWDESIHYMGAVGYAKTLTGGGTQLFHNLLYQSDFYPPLGEFLAGVVFLVTGASPDVAAFLNVFYLIGILILLWRIGTRLYDETTGLLAGMVFASGAMIVLQSKFFMLDIPLVFFFLLGIDFYLQSERFTRRGWTLAYGAVLGFSLLLKWSSLFFLAFPPLVLLVAAWIRKDPARKSISANLVLAGLVAAALAAPWYSVHLIKLFKNTRGYVYDRGEVENDPSLASPASWFFYLFSVVRQLSWPLGLLVLTGLALYFKDRRHAGFLALWVGVPYLVLTLIRNKDHRYTFPLLALACLAGLSWVAKVKAPWRQRLIAGMVVLAAGQFVFCHVAQPAALARILERSWWGTPLVESMAPDPREWPLQQIMEDAGRASSLPAPRLRVIPDHARFSQVAFAVAQAQRPNAVQLASITDWPSFTDFAVTKTGSLGLAFMEGDRKPIHESLANSASAMGQRFARIQTYPLPDGTEAWLFQRMDPEEPVDGKLVVDSLRNSIRTLLEAYVRNVEELAIDFEQFSERETRRGRFQSIRIRAKQGLLGDFKHKPLGVPFHSLDLELRDVTLDLRAAGEGRLIPYALGELRVHALALDAAKANHVLAGADDDLRRLRVGFQQQWIIAAWKSKIPASVGLRLEVVPDPLMPGSDNLRFHLGPLRIWRLPLPLGWLQPLVDDFNPLLKSAGFPARIKLGRIMADQDRLAIGDGQ